MPVACFFFLDEVFVMQVPAYNKMTDQSQAMLRLSKCWHVNTLSMWKAGCVKFNMNSLEGILFLSGIRDLSKGRYSFSKM